MNKATARELLRQFDFKALFLNELGWDDHDGSLPLKVGEDTVTLTAVAEKRGMAAYLCVVPGQRRSYDYQTRCKIEIQLAKSVREHLVIYADPNRRFQTWQWVKREPGKPIARREHTLTANQSGEALLQKIEALEVKIEEEDQLTLVGITARARQAFDVDRVTKRFYDRFKTEHAAFLKQIEGIGDEDECEWYASIMLNRLKFVYFIQKKGFLDQDKDYLRNRLAMVQKTRPKTKFLTFYRAFLLKLFHDGLGRKERSPELHKLLGTVPYLNGGIFAVHPLEEKYTGIDIPDKAFEKVFAFFDQYRWHLDERPLRADDEINPDVLGYIFEKYINQKQMGAYYTKEDITEYIAKNCIVPFILDRVETDLKKKPDAFRALFQLLAADPDRYIYDPVKHGVVLPLPPEIEKGVDTKKPNLMERRAAWNKPASSEYALPTEIWREVVARRQRCAELRTRLSAIMPDAAQSFTANELITLNLNIRQFAQDCIENAATPDVLWAFWQAIEQITVLDPTCGSGAFLFAAVNVLEPLYEACLDRMKAFMLEWRQSIKAPYPNFYNKFDAVIARVEKHANEKYFIFKSIIIRNLYGVDIMDEAVEICKLRLFLKLAAQIEPDYSQENLGIEPLPDIDFNVRAGNTLVGFATEKQAEEVIRQDLLAYNTVWPEVQRDVKEIAEMFALFRQQQTDLGGAVCSEDKARLRKRITPLEARLNQYLADAYDINTKAAVKEWVSKHKPFHWFIEFYAIISSGGFCVVIGNPPYVECHKNTKGTIALVDEYKTHDTANLYPFIVERSTHLVRPRGSLGVILPLSAFCTQRMEPLVSLIVELPGDKWISHFGWRPATLFSGVNIPLSIILCLPHSGSRLYTTTFQKWYQEARDYLFSLIQYADTEGFVQNKYVIPKIGNSTEQSILRKAFSQGKTVAAYLAGGKQGATLYYRNTGGLYWRIITDFQPLFELDHTRMASSTESTLILRDTKALSAITAVLNTNFFWLYYVVYSSFHHVNPIDILTVPIDLESVSPDLLKKLCDCERRLMDDLKAKSQIRLRCHKGGNESSAQTFFPSRSKPLVDATDIVVAMHYGFSPHELDYILNYDIKYRTVGTADEEEDE